MHVLTLPSKLRPLINLCEERIWGIPNQKFARQIQIFQGGQQLEMKNHSRAREKTLKLEY